MIARGSEARPYLVALVAAIALSACGVSCGGGQPEGTTLPAIAEANLPRADLRLLVMTDLMGYLEPCGCTSRPLGGIDRLAAKVAAIRSEGIATAFVEAGDLFFDATNHGVSDADASTQELWKADTVVDVLSRLQLDAATPGPLDLRYGIPAFEALKERARFPLLGAGVTITKADGATDALPGFVVRQVGGTKVGIVGVSVIDGVEGVTSAADPVAAAQDAVRSARAEGAEIVVALARAPRRVVRRIATEVEGLDFVVLGGADEAAAGVPIDTETGAVILHASRQGMGLLQVDLVKGQGGRWVDASRWTREVEREHANAEAESLRARIAEWERDTNVAAADLTEQRRRLTELEQRARDVAAAPAIAGRAFSASYQELAPESPRDDGTRAELDAYFQRVNEHNRVAFADLLPRPPAEGRPSFVGSEACGSCHAAELAWWRTTMHGRAYRTLQDLHKEYNLSCVGCHVVGYNQPGGSTVAHVGVLQDVGCENCHGPGSQHVESPTAAAVNVRLDPPEEVCTGCHNAEHSDRFHFPTYRRMMIAPGHGMPETGS